MKHLPTPAQRPSGWYVTTVETCTPCGSVREINANTGKFGPWKLRGLRVPTCPGAAK